jgi:hypothetical protein
MKMIKLIKEQQEEGAERPSEAFESINIFLSSV